MNYRHAQQRRKSIGLRYKIPIAGIAFLSIVCIGVFLK